MSAHGAHARASGAGAGWGAQARLAAALLLLAPPAAATDAPSCGTTAGPAEAIFAEAQAAGFRVLAQGQEIAPEIADRLSWIVAMPYLVADTGGEALGDILAMQAKSAGNLTRLVDTPHSATRAFVHDDQSVMVVRWQELPGGVNSVRCSAALFLDDGAAPQPSTGRFGAFSHQKIDNGIDVVDVEVERFQLDRAAIRAKAPHANPPHLIMTIVMTYSREVYE